MAATYEDLLSLFQETDRRFQESRAEADRRFQETERLLKERSAIQDASYQTVRTGYAWM